MKGAQIPSLGLQPTPAQPVPSVSKHPSILNLWEVDPLGLEVFWNRSPSPAQPGGPTWPQGRCLFSQGVRIPVLALPTGRTAFKKISVINVVSFVVSHWKGSERGFIFLTCLA